MAGVPSLAEQAAAIAVDAEEVAALARQGKKRVPHVGDHHDMSADRYRRAEHAKRMSGLPTPYAFSILRTVCEESGRGKYMKGESRVKSHGKQGFNVKGVVDVLLEEGFDPTVEVVKILRGRQDPDRPDDPEARVYQVPADIRLRFASELMKFVHPTKKAVEVEDKTPPLAGRALDARLGALVQQYLHVVGGEIPPEVSAALEAVRNELPEVSSFRVLPPADEPEDFDPYSML